MAAAPSSRSGQPLPRWVRFAGIPLSAVVLTSFFIFLGFPYDLVRDRLVFQLESATGAEIEIGELSARVTVGGPGLAAAPVSAVLPGRQRIEIERLRLRPAWSLAWLQGNAALHVDIESPLGELDGVVFVGSEPGFAGKLRGVQLSSLPLDGVLPDLTLEGSLDLDADVRRDAETGDPRGEVTFAATEGSVLVAAAPMPVPYDTLRGSVLLGGDQLALIREIELDGPMIGAKITGTIEHAEVRGDAPLALEATVVVKVLPMQALVRRLGVQLDQHGSADVQLGGTLQNPRLKTTRSGQR